MSLDPINLAKLRGLLEELQPKPKQCPDTGKRSFATQAEADAFLYSPQVDITRDKVPCKSYRCPHCGDWHLTAKNG